MVGTTTAGVVAIADAAIEGVAIEGVAVAASTVADGVAAAEHAATNRSAAVASPASETNRVVGRMATFRDSVPPEARVCTEYAAARLVAQER
jgi:hypothetical protein